jgi:hypothetical protein
VYRKIGSSDSSVGIAADYRRGRPEVRFQEGVRAFSLFHSVETGSGARPTCYPMGTGGLSLEIKRPGHEAGHQLLPRWVKKVELYLHFRVGLYGVVLNQLNTGTILPYHKIK